VSIVKPGMRAIGRRPGRSARRWSICTPTSSRRYRLIEKVSDKHNDK